MIEEGGLIDRERQGDVKDNQSEVELDCEAEFWDGMNR